MRLKVLHDSLDAVAHEDLVEVHQEAKPATSQFEVGKHLGNVDGGEFLDSLDFDNHQTADDEIQPVSTIELLSFVVNW
jgi:hypothetical protein